MYFVSLSEVGYFFRFERRKWSHYYSVVLGRAWNSEMEACFILQKEKVDVGLPYYLLWSKFSVIVGLEFIIKKWELFSYLMALTWRTWCFKKKHLKWIWSFQQRKLSKKKILNTSFLAQVWAFPGSVVEQKIVEFQMLSATILATAEC